MNNLKFLILIFTVAACCATAAPAQNRTDVKNPQQKFDEPEQRRPQMLRELGLTPEQVRQIRQINVFNRERMREAQIRLREANRNLDQAIYADNSDETLIQQRLTEFIQAQAEVAKIRTMTEFAIRKILSPEQLERFRRMRQRFQQMRQQNRRDHDRAPQNDRVPPQDL